MTLVRKKYDIISFKSGIPKTYERSDENEDENFSILDNFHLDLQRFDRMSCYIIVTILKLSASVLTLDLSNYFIMKKRQ